MHTNVRTITVIIIISGALTADKAKGVVPVGINLMYDGTVPKGSGLSSSAAILCSTVLGVLYVNNIMSRFSRMECAQVGIAAEHGVGVRCGGMDQTISMAGMYGMGDGGDDQVDVDTSHSHLHSLPSLSVCQIVYSCWLILLLSLRSTRQLVTDIIGVSWNVG